MYEMEIIDDIDKLNFDLLISKIKENNIELDAILEYFDKTLKFSDNLNNKQYRYTFGYPIVILKNSSKINNENQIMFYLKKIYSIIKNKITEDISKNKRNE